MFSNDGAEPGCQLLNMGSSKTWIVRLLKIHPESAGKKYLLLSMQSLEGVSPAARPETSCAKTVIILWR